MNETEWQSYDAAARRGSSPGGVPDSLCAHGGHDETRPGYGNAHRDADHGGGTKETGLQPNKVITNDDVELKPVDGTTVSTTTLRSTDAVVNMMVDRPYAQGTPIVSESLKEPGIAQRLDKGSRAFSMAIREINTFNSGINDGDSIDILWSKTYAISGYVQPPSGGQPEKIERQFATTKTLLQSIKVLKVVSLKLGTTQSSSSSGVVNTQGGGSTSASDQQKAQQAVQAAYAEDAPYSMVLILAVTDQQAEVIKFAREEGKVDIALRATDDTDRETTTGITDRILVDNTGGLPELLVR